MNIPQKSHEIDKENIVKLANIIFKLGWKLKSGNLVKSSAGNPKVEDSEIKKIIYDVYGENILAQQLDKIVDTIKNDLNKILSFSSIKKEKDEVLDDVKEISLMVESKYLAMCCRNDFVKNPFKSELYKIWLSNNPSTAGVGYLVKNKKEKIGNVYSFIGGEYLLESYMKNRYVEDSGKSFESIHEEDYLNLVNHLSSYKGFHHEDNLYKNKSTYSTILGFYTEVKDISDKKPSRVSMSLTKKYSPKLFMKYVMDNLVGNGGHKQLTNYQKIANDMETPCSTYFKLPENDVEFKDIGQWRYFHHLMRHSEDEWKTFCAYFYAQFKGDHKSTQGLGIITPSNVGASVLGEVLFEMLPNTTVGIEDDTLSGKGSFDLSSLINCNLTINDDCKRISFFGDEYVKKILTGTEFVINEKNEKKFRAILHSMSLSFSNSGFIIDSTKPDEKRRALIIRFLKYDVDTLNSIGLPLVSAKDAKRLLIRDVYNFISYCKNHYYNLLDEKGNFMLLPDVNNNIENSDEEAVVFKDYIISNYCMNDRKGSFNNSQLLSLTQIYDDIRENLRKSKYASLNNNSIKIYIQKAIVSLFEDVNIIKCKVNGSDIRGFFSLDNNRIFVHK